MQPSFILSLLLLPFCAQALQIFPSGSVGDFPSTCGSVLTHNITACNNLVGAFDTSTDYAQNDLEQACTSSCSEALNNWYKETTALCSNVTYIDDQGFTQEVAGLVGMIGYHFNQTCQMNNGQYCNVVIGNLTAANATGSALCNECVRLKLQSEAQSPYDDGPLVYSESLYQSYTSSCGISGKPLTTAPPTQTTATA